MSNREISDFLQERIDAGDFPSAVYIVAENGKIAFQDALGYAVVQPELIEASPTTVYDLASLTKPLVTGLLFAKLIESGDAEPDDTLSRYFDGVRGDKSEITVRSLLTHTSRLPAWKPFYLFVDRPDEVFAEIIRTPFNGLQDAVTYSDLNFLLLASILERIAGDALDSQFKRQIAEPLGLKDSLFCPPAVMRSRIAASEKGNEYEKQTCIESYPDRPIPPGAFRDRQIWGEVHDGNAWFMGGTAGHAGLFSTAGEVLKIGLQFLANHSTLLKPATCSLFRTNFTAGANEDRSFAFQLASTNESTAGQVMSPESFGHLGFTGTSLWIDPVADRVFVLLTNRTHAHPLPFVNINSVRRQFHNLAANILDKKTSN